MHTISNPNFWFYLRLLKAISLVEKRPKLYRKLGIQGLCECVGSKRLHAKPHYHNSEAHTSTIQQQIKNHKFTLHFRQPRRRLKLQRSQWRLLQPKLRLNLKLEQEQRKAKPHPRKTTPPKVANMQHHQQLGISNHQTRHQRNVWKGNKPIHPVFQLLLLTKTMHKSSKNCKRRWFDVVFFACVFHVCFECRSFQSRKHLNVYCESTQFWSLWRQTGRCKQRWLPSKGGSHTQTSPLPHLELLHHLPRLPQHQQPQRLRSLLRVLSIRQGKDHPHPRRGHGWTDCDGCVKSNHQVNAKYHLRSMNVGKKATKKNANPC